MLEPQVCPLGLEPVICWAVFLFVFFTYSNNIMQMNCQTPKAPSGSQVQWLSLPVLRGKEQTDLPTSLARLFFPTEPPPEVQFTGAAQIRHPSLQFHTRGGEWVFQPPCLSKYTNLFYLIYFDLTSNIAHIFAAI